jgi:hypothetical protein
MEPEVGLLAMERGDDRRHQVGTQGWRDSEPDGSRPAFGGTPRQGANVADPDQEAAGAIGDLASDRRQFDAAGPAFDQLDAEPLLEGAKLVAQRRLRNVTCLRSPAEMLHVRNRDKIFELAESRHENPIANLYQSPQLLSMNRASSARL